MRITQLARAIFGTAGLCLGAATTIAGSADLRTPSCLIEKQPAKQPLSAVCLGTERTDSSVLDTQMYRDLRTELMMESGHISVQRLCAVEEQLSAAAREAERARKATETESIAALLLLLAGNWEEVKQYQLAKSAYIRSYELAKSAGNPSLTALAALQRLVNLESDNGAMSCAVEVADAQEEMARHLNADASQSLELVAQALELKADLLRKNGRHAEADAVIEKAAALRKQDTCSGVCR
jgi:tetratricopeptide (TPR) repeat protein